MEKVSLEKVDLIVIGSGMAGMAAGAFAAASGIKTVLMGASSGEMPFASGLLDLLGVYPAEEKRVWDNPWAGIEALIEACPEHPYALLGLERIRSALTKFLDLLETAGLKYCGWPDRNAVLSTSIGTRKITWRVPETMWQGVMGLREKRAALIIDFEGMKDFSARQLVETIARSWPGIRSRRLKFPYPLRGSERQNTLMAEALELPEVRTALADNIRSVLAGAEMVGLPAVVGLRQCGRLVVDLEEKIGVPVFEIPTMPPSIPGLRLKEALEQTVLRGGGVVMPGVRATSVKCNGDGSVSVSFRSGRAEKTIAATGLVLATGRFLGRGLVAERTRIREVLLNLPVKQPEMRDLWHRVDFFDLRGHPVNKAGVVVDGMLRPTGLDGKVVGENMFVAGSLLANQDWMRTRCGAGIAVSTAYHAVQSFLRSQGFSRASSGGGSR